MRTLACSLALSLVSASLIQGQVTFKARTDAVLVDVAVTKDRAPVRGLKPENFDVLDDGVKQEVLEAQIEETLPLDLSIIADTSTSVVGRNRDSILTAVRSIAGVLRPGDRLHLTNVNGGILTLLPENFYRGVAEQARGHLADGGTPLFDAIALSAMRKPAAGARPVIVALTDGVDTSSVLPENISKAVLRKTDATVYCVEVAEWPHLWVLGFVATSQDNGIRPTQLTYDVTLSGMINDTGGRLMSVTPEQDFAAAVNELLAGLRARYLLRYVPKGVDHLGWHALEVHVNSGKFDVQARKGYQKDPGVPVNEAFSRK